MKTVSLKKVEHGVKIGDVCGPIEPNVTEDCFLEENGEILGFYLADLSKLYPRAAKLAEVANAELRSDRVPKTTMDRKRPLGDGSYLVVSQYSTIIGSVPPKPHMRRNYPTRSSVHGVASARLFVSAMLQLCLESERIIGELAPKIHARQLEIITQKVPEKWRFCNLFTSSISNYNIAAPFHRDNANIVGCVNVIIAKRWGANGGNTTVPEYGATFDSRDNSMLVYPAWRNVHGVTPIEPRMKGGYRNSLVFYPLKAFEKYG